MKTFLLFLLGFIVFKEAAAQKVDSIYFHLYTDSLKKGQHNYINVDAKMSDGRWLPMTAKEISLTSSHGSFDGNDLFIPRDFKEAKVTVKAILKGNPKLQIEKTIWIKTLPDPDSLPTKDDMLNKPKEKTRNRN